MPACQWSPGISAPVPAGSVFLVFVLSLIRKTDPVFIQKLSWEFLVLSEGTPQVTRG